MSTDTERLAERAERERGRIDSTIDELRSRLSVGQIVDEMWSQMKGSQGSDAVKNLGRQVRDNPLAVGLIGAGVAWLMAGGGVRAEARHLRDRYDGWTHADNRYRDGRTTGSGSHGANSSRPSGSMFADPQDGEGAGLTDRASEAASDALDTVSDAARRTGAAISDGADGVYDSASRYGRDVGRTAQAAAHSASDWASDGTNEIYRAGRRVQRTFLNVLHEEPLILGGVALAVGAALGAAIPATRTENEYLGPARDDLRDSALAYGEEVIEKAESVAEKAYDAASTEAERKGLTSSDDDETVAEKIGDVAKAGTEAAKREAKSDL
jgi:hypothetical protein